jgi:hypothetical protein
MLQARRRSGDRGLREISVSVVIQSFGMRRPLLGGMNGSTASIA